MAWCASRSISQGVRLCSALYLLRKSFISLINTFILSKHNRYMKTHYTRRYIYNWIVYKHIVILGIAMICVPTSGVIISGVIMAWHVFNSHIMIMEAITHGRKDIGQKLTLICRYVQVHQLYKATPTHRADNSSIHFLFDASRRHENWPFVAADASNARLTSHGQHSLQTISHV